MSRVVLMVDELAERARFVFGDEFVRHRGAIDSSPRASCPKLFAIKMDLFITRSVCSSKPISIIGSRPRKRFQGKFRSAVRLNF